MTTVKSPLYSGPPSGAAARPPPPPQRLAPEPGLAPPECHETGVPARSGVLEPRFQLRRAPPRGKPERPAARPAGATRRAAVDGRLPQPNRSIRSRCSSQSRAGRWRPNVRKNSGMCSASSFQACGSTVSSRSRSAQLMSRPSRSSEPGAGQVADRGRHGPGVAGSRSMIHFSTRLFSPKPGQRNLPSASLRNQLT